MNIPSAPFPLHQATENQWTVVELTGRTALSKRGPSQPTGDNDDRGCGLLPELYR